MSVQATAPHYPQMLRRAYGLGLADGRFARCLEAAGGHQVGGMARGRTPHQFAAWLWRGHSGQPPAGLEVNTPLWYAAGFADGLSGSPSDECTPR